MRQRSPRRCQGYIVPEYFRWPGYLSPEKGLKLPDGWDLTKGLTFWINYSNPMFAEK